MNRQEERAARKYARAFLNVFGSDINQQDADNLKKAQTYFLQHEHACFLMDLSLLPQEVKVHALNTLCDQFFLPSSCKKLCMLLLEHQRASLLPAVFGFIVHEYYKDSKVYFFKVSTVHDMTDVQKERVESFLRSQVSGAVSCEYKIDKTLIAGIRIYSTILLWENSVKGRLRALKETLRF